MANPPEHKPVDLTLANVTDETLIEFPCVFPVKVMGEMHDTFSGLMVELVQVHVPSFDATSVEMRASSGGRFISLTCHVNVDSKEQLDNVYRALSAHPLVKFVL